MLKIENLLLTYGTLPVFSGMSLEVDRGEIVCLCGESGSGKSSMLKSIQGFVDAEGTIEVDGKVLDVNTVDAIRQKIAYVPQDISLPYDTVEQMVMSLFELRLNRNIRFSKEMMLADWSQLGLDSSLWDKRINEISGGQRQRIMLSVAGLTGKCLLLADEPTSALDSESALLVANYFRMLARERNMAILVVSHSGTFAKECDRVVKF
jgi:polar amino acid transport system ATP-binding protein/putative ABC transport system ATP-binding protein